MAWALTRDHGSSDAPEHDHSTHDHSTHDHGATPSVPSPQPGPAPTTPAASETGYENAEDAPNSAGSGVPVDARGPANLAVAWWPQDISLAQHAGTDATLRFQSTVANIGGEAIDVRPGDRVEFTVSRQDTKGIAGEVVGRGSAPLNRADVEPFPVAEGVEIGRDVSTFGTELETISSLGPRTAAIVGAVQPSQAIQLHGATKGLYVLRQQIVHADGTRDVNGFDDARLTEFMLDGSGGILHTSSRYAG